MLLLGRGTFRLLFQGQEVGRIQKKWGGLLREAFSDADTFGVECEPTVPHQALGGTHAHPDESIML